MADQWERVSTRTKRMWWKIGTLLEEAAHEYAEKGIDGTAMRLAASAEAAYAQSTGDCDGFTITDFVARRAAHSKQGGENG